MGDIVEGCRQVEALSWSYTTEETFISKRVRVCRVLSDGVLGGKRDGGGV